MSAGLETVAGFCTGWRIRIVVSRNFYRGKPMAEMDLPDIDLEGRVVIMTGADAALAAR
jgi:hypothetical protein